MSLQRPHLRAPPGFEPLLESCATFLSGVCLAQGRIKMQKRFVEPPASRYSPRASSPPWSQVLGPDGLLVQTSDRVEDFWAWRDGLGLGFLFNSSSTAGAGPADPAEAGEGGGVQGGLVPAARFREACLGCGFQATTDFHQGALVADNGP